MSSALPAQVTQATALNDNHAIPPAVITHLKNAEADLDNKVDMAIDAINAHEATHPPDPVPASHDSLHPALPPADSHTLSGVATHSNYPALPPAIVKHLNNFEDNLTKHVDVYVNKLAALDSKVDLAPAPAPSMHYRRMRA